MSMRICPVMPKRSGEGLGMTGKPPPGRGREPAPLVLDLELFERGAFQRPLADSAARAASLDEPV